MILRIVEARVRGPQLLWLAFDDETRKTMYVRVRGPVFESLRDP